MNKTPRLVGLVAGFLLAFFSFLIAFGLSAGNGDINFGAAGGLFHIVDFFYIFGITTGGLLVAFPISDLWYCFRDAFTPPEPESSNDPINHDLRKNAMICQLASRLTIMAGFIAAIGGFIVVMFFKIGGDTMVVGQGIATAMAAVLLSLVLAAFLTALKFRFLDQIQHEE